MKREDLNTVVLEMIDAQEEYEKMCAMYLERIAVMERGLERIANKEGQAWIIACDSLERQRNVERRAYERARGSV